MKDSKAFTLSELLVVAGIIAVFIMMVFTGLARTGEDAKAAECLNNLSWVYRAASMYMSDYDGRIFGSLENHTGSTVNTWGRTLSVNDYLKPADPVLFCPVKTALQAERESRPGHWPFFTYAINVTRPDSRDTIFSYRVERPIGVLNQSSIKDPENYWFFTDASVFDSYGESSQFNRLRADETENIEGRGVHLRHNGKAGMVFLDGNVELAGGEKLSLVSPLPFQQGFDEDGSVIDF